MNRFASLLHFEAPETKKLHALPSAAAITEPSNGRHASSTEFERKN
jgi:hypothetical protein